MFLFYYFDYGMCHLVLYSFSISTVIKHTKSQFLNISHNSTNQHPYHKQCIPGHAVGEVSHCLVNPAMKSISCYISTRVFHSLEKGTFADCRVWTSPRACWPIFLPLHLFVRLNPTSSMKTSWVSTAATSTSKTLGNTHDNIRKRQGVLTIVKHHHHDDHTDLCILYTVLRECINCGIVQDWVAFRSQPGHLFHPQIISRTWFMISVPFQEKEDISKHLVLVIFQFK